MRSLLSPQQGTCGAFPAGPAGPARRPARPEAWASPMATSRRRHEPRLTQLCSAVGARPHPSAAAAAATAPAGDGPRFRIGGDLTAELAQLQAQIEATAAARDYREAAVLQNAVLALQPESRISLAEAVAHGRAASLNEQQAAFLARGFAVVPDAVGQELLAQLQVGCAAAAYLRTTLSPFPLKHQPK